MREKDFERELDAALARYGVVEPRNGLEQRVLANLRAQNARATRFEWRRWAATGFAVASLAVLLIWAGERNWAPVNITSRTTQDGVPWTIARVPLATATPSGHNGITGRARQSDLTERNARESGDSLPKLAQFPAPEPLSEQEKLLVRYVEQSPQDAALVAEAMNLEKQRELDEMKALNEKIESE